VALLGANGAGKTSLLMMICGSRYGRCLLLTR
jgi:ABC-type multidrug transport system ATPase subunit